MKGYYGKSEGAGVKNEKKTSDLGLPLFGPDLRSLVEAAFIARYYWKPRWQIRFGSVKH